MNLKKELSNRSLTQKKICEEIGICPINFNRILNGKRKLSIKLAAKIGKRLNLDIGLIYERYGEKLSINIKRLG